MIKATGVFGKSKKNSGKMCNFPDDGCVHTSSTIKKGNCKYCKLYY